MTQRRIEWPLHNSSKDKLRNSIFNFPPNCPPLFNKTPIWNCAHIDASEPQMYGAQSGETMCWMKYRKRGREGGIGRDWGEGEKHMEERVEEGFLCVCEEEDEEEMFGRSWGKTVGHSVNGGLMKVLIMELVTFQPVTDPVALIDPMWSVIRRHNIDWWLCCAARHHHTELPAETPPTPAAGSDQLFAPINGMIE